MRKAQYYLITFICILLWNCKRTSTPKEFLNYNEVEPSEYVEDKEELVEVVKSRRDSLRLASATPEGKSLEVFIDTIFYGPNGKIVLISITKKENPYSLNSDGVSFMGETYIGLKEKESKEIKITDRLKYSSTSDETDGFERVQKSIRNTYLKEMEYIDNRFNINDNRFWTSQVWENW